MAAQKLFQVPCHDEFGFEADQDSSGGGQKLTGVDAEALRELEDVPDRDVALAPFNRADIGTVKASAVGELFLGNSGSNAEAL